ncbi:hypothetical protein EMPS_09579 [Entomortierella parvispora]|uniref:Uncharacterized protein n=1 Tax=Entomortierella parvispora TaxID=205924 RepID=A0A9P3HIB6_9FUNG|nr:hypothetical protein EMPS_09579 [Entomortierella parvispora]
MKTMFKTIPTLALLATAAILQAQAHARLVARDDPSTQAVSGGTAPSDPSGSTAANPDQGDNDKWGWGYSGWGYGYPFYGYGYGYGYRPFYSGWWY